MARRGQRRRRDSKPGPPVNEHHRRRLRCQPGGRHGTRSLRAFRPHRHLGQQRRFGGGSRPGAHSGAGGRRLGHGAARQRQRHVPMLSGRGAANASRWPTGKNNRHLVRRGQAGHRPVRRLLRLQVCPHRLHPIPGPGACAPRHKRQRHLPRVGGYGENFRDCGGPGARGRNGGGVPRPHVCGTGQGHTPGPGGPTAQTWPTRPPS